MDLKNDIGKALNPFPDLVDYNPKDDIIDTYDIIEAYVALSDSYEKASEKLQDLKNVVNSYAVCDDTAYEIFKIKEHLEKISVLYDIIADIDGGHLINYIDGLK